MGNNASNQDPFGGSTGVEHNLMRYLGTSNASNLNDTTNSDLFDVNQRSYAEDYEQEDLEEDKAELDEMMLDYSVVEKTQKQILSFDEKTRIREDLFYFLDVSQEEESNLVSLSLHYLELSADAICFSIPVMLQDKEYQRLKQSNDLQAEVVGDQLLSLQLENLDRLKGLFNAYQPSPFNRAWGSDPDYVSLTNQLKYLLMSDAGELFGASMDGSTEKIKKTGKKTTKKKGKKRAEKAVEQTMKMCGNWMMLSLISAQIILVFSKKQLNNNFQRQNNENNDSKKRKFNALKQYQLLSIK